MKTAGIANASQRADLGALVAGIRAVEWPADIAAARRLMDAEGTPAADDIGVEPIKIGARPGRIVVPPKVRHDRAILYLHGGGYVYGSFDSHAGLVAELARAALGRVYYLDYRLAPEHPFPAALEDACAAYLWLRRRGYAAGDIAIVGDSAGGGLVIATLLALRDAGETLPGTAVCLSPWVDLEALGDSYTTRQAGDPMITRELVQFLAGLYAASADLRNPLISPLYGDLSGLPRLLIQVGECEVLFSEAQTLARRAEAAGVDVTFEEWADMIHVWQLYFPRLAAGRAAIERIGTFIANIAAPAAATA